MTKLLETYLKETGKTDQDIQNMSRKELEEIADQVIEYIEMCKEDAAADYWEKHLAEYDCWNGEYRDEDIAYTSRYMLEIFDSKDRGHRLLGTVFDMRSIEYDSIYDYLWNA